MFGPIIAALAFLGLALGGNEGQPFLLTAGLVFLIALPFQFLIDRTRLELSVDGVRVRQTGYHLQASWSDIAELRLQRATEGFVTSRRMSGKGPAVLAAFRGVRMPGASFYDAEQQALLAEQRFIPIEAFAWHMRHGALGDDIVRFAPHLRQQIEIPEKPRQKMSRQEAWSLTISLAITFGFIFLGVRSNQHEGGRTWIELVALTLLSLWATVAGIRSVWNAWRAFTKRRWLSSFVFALFALILLLLAIVWWAELANLKATPVPIDQKTFT